MRVKTILMKKMIDRGHVIELVKKASQYSSIITIEKSHYKADAKSTLGVFAMLIENGDEITIKTQGEDEEEAVKDLGLFLEQLN
jgi:phosphotransferase system HPr (HPr) family protein